jgi:PAS domain S-box-containing protein
MTAPFSVTNGNCSAGAAAGVRPPNGLTFFKTCMVSRTSVKLSHFEFLEYAVSISKRRKNGVSMFDEAVNDIRSSILKDASYLRFRSDLASPSSHRQAVFDALTDGVLILDAGRRIRTSNKAAEIIFNRSASELIGKLCSELYPINNPIRHGICEKCLCLTRQKMETKIGGHWLEITIDPLTGPRGECLGAIHVLRDITRQKFADEELRRRNDRFQFLISATPAVIYTCKPDGDYAATFVSENVQNHFGYSAGEFLSDPQFWIKHVHRADRARIFSELPRLLEQGASAYEYRFKAGDGRWLWVHDEARLIKDDSGRPLEIIGYFVDVTARKEAEIELMRAKTGLEERVIERTSQLEDTHKQLRSFLENSAVVAWMKDEKGRYVFVSKNFQKRFKLRFEDWNGKTDSDLWPKADARQFRRDDLAVLRKNRTGVFLERSSNPNGSSSWWSTRKFIFRDSAGKRFIGGLAVDVTQRKKAEEAARALQLKLLRTLEQLKTETAETISLREAIVGAGERERERLGQDLHDGLCQFLTAIRIKADMLEQRLSGKGSSDTGSVQELVKLLKQAVDQAHSLAQGLQPVEQVPEGLASALHQLAATMTSLFGVSCQCHIPQPVHIANHAVAVDLFYIAHEAVANAIKHTKTRSVSISLTRHAKEIALRVTHGGKQFDGRASTNGLGLKTMRYRAERIGARLEFRPRFGGRSLLICSVPISRTNKPGTHLINGRSALLRGPTKKDYELSSKLKVS